MSTFQKAARNRRHLGARFERLEDRVMLAADGFEQEFVYLLNSARNDPSAYQAARNLPVNLSGVVPRGPLAVNDMLYDAAETKATDMTSNNYFSHVSPRGVRANALVRNAGYPLPNLFPDNMNFVESLAGGTQYDNAADVLDLLVIDAGLATPSHRIQLLGLDDFQAANREIGVGLSSSASADFTNYWAIHIARREISANHLTGVVFNDVDGDGAYDRGEGLSNVQVSVTGATTTTARTNAAGGWSVAANDGVHSIVASGAAFSGVSSATATISGENVAVDFVSGNVASQVAFTENFGSNILDRFDVDGIDGPTVLDALIIVNHIGRASEGATSIYNAPTFLDVNGGGTVDALDALQVINQIARTRSAASPELSLVEIGSDEGDDALLEVVSELEPTRHTPQPQKIFTASPSEQAEYPFLIELLSSPQETVPEASAGDQSSLAINERIEYRI